MADAPQVVPESVLGAVLPSMAEKDGFHIERNGDTPAADCPAEFPIVFGLRRRNFWILFAMVVTLMAATIGGSVGGALAVERAKYVDCSEGLGKASSSDGTNASTSSSSSSAITSTKSSTIASTAGTSGYTPAAPSAIAQIDNDCPESNSLKSFSRDRYNCSNAETIRGSDIAAFVAYTLQQCVDACSTQNWIKGNLSCKAVVLNDDLSANYENNHGANCWLKGGAAGASPDEHGTLAVLQMLP